MLRPAVAAFSASSFAQHKTIPSLASRSYAHRTKPPPQDSESEDSATKRWLAVHQGKKEAIPRKIAQIKTSGSASKGGLSGANTKITLEIPLNALSNHVSPEMVPGIKGLPCYAHASDQLIVRSDEGKRKEHNVRECYRKVSELLIGIGEDVVSRETGARLPSRYEATRGVSSISVASYRKMKGGNIKKYRDAKLAELEKAKKAEKLERFLQARRGEK